MKKRVCFLIPDLHDGGAQVQCLRLLEELQTSTEIEQMLIYLHDGVHSRNIEQAKYKIKRVQVKSNYDPRNILYIRDAMRDFQPDLIFSWLHACDVYGFFLSRMNPRTPWLMAERGSTYPRELRYMLREVLGRHADGIVCNSAAGRKCWVDRGARGNLYVVPNIVAKSAPSTLGVQASRIVAVGRLEPQKNPLVMIAAFCELAAQRPDLEFVVVGEGSLRPKIEAMISEAGMSDRVILLGFRDDARELIGSSRLLVTLSNFEGTPNVLLEAIAAETPAVVSDIPEHREVLGDNYPFYVEDRGNPTASAERILHALASDVDAQTYTYACERLAQMSAEKVVERYAEIFKALAR